MKLCQRSSRMPSSCSSCSLLSTTHKRRRRYACQSWVGLRAAGVSWPYRCWNPDPGSARTSVHHWGNTFWRSLRYDWSTSESLGPWSGEHYFIRMDSQIYRESHTESKGNHTRTASRQTHLRRSSEFSILLFPEVEAFSTWWGWDRRSISNRCRRGFRDVKASNLLYKKKQE